MKNTNLYSKLQRYISKIVNMDIKLSNELIPLYEDLIYSQKYMEICLMRDKEIKPQFYEQTYKLLKRIDKFISIEGDFN